MNHYLPNNVNSDPPLNKPTGNCVYVGVDVVHGTFISGRTILEVFIGLGFGRKTLMWEGMTSVTSIEPTQLGSPQHLPVGYLPK